VFPESGFIYVRLLALSSGILFSGMYICFPWLSLDLRLFLLSVTMPFDSRKKFISKFFSRIYNFFLHHKDYISFLCRVCTEFRMDFTAVISFSRQNCPRIPQNLKRFLIVRRFSIP
jgi:hypothetical protein